MGRSPWSQCHQTSLCYRVFVVSWGWYIHYSYAFQIQRNNLRVGLGIQQQRGGNNLQGWRKALQDAVYALNQCTIYGAVSSIARTHPSRIQGWKWEWHHSWLPLSIWLQKFGGIFTANLCSVVLVVLLPKAVSASTRRHKNDYMNKLAGHIGLLMGLNQEEWLH